ncbi:hypothetical protein BTVI_55990 [Pitangus sulphuratus]|nr:hypothetical protein BTVI_55990 [Pitangus sulphuratus]
MGTEEGKKVSSFSNSSSPMKIQGQTENGKQLYGAPHNKLQKLLKEKVNCVHLKSSKLCSWPWTLLNERSGQGFTYTLTCAWYPTLWGWLDPWKKADWKHRGKPIWAANIWQDIAARIEKLIVRVCHVDAYVPKNRANEQHGSNGHVDRATQVEVLQVDLDW